MDRRTRKEKGWCKNPNCNGPHRHDRTVVHDPWYCSTAFPGYCFDCGSAMQNAVINSMSKRTNHVFCKGEIVPVRCDLTPGEFKILRKRARWSQTQLAKKCGLSEETIYNLENARSGTSHAVRMLVYYVLLVRELEADTPVINPELG